MNRLSRMLIIVFIFCLLQASVISGQDEAEKKPWTGKLGDGTEITESDLQKIVEEHFAYVIFNGKKGKKAFLKEAYLISVDLSEAYLRDADLREANLFSADLSGANLSVADLKSADLRSADLSGAHMNAATLRKADLSSADLSGADLRQADLSGADLISANLSGVNLRVADLSEADLISADLSGADLSMAYLRGADLRQADLSGADLRQADLSNAAISGADLTGCYFEGTEGFPLPEIRVGETRVELAQEVLPVYEPKAGSVPDIPSMAGLPNLEHMTYKDHPHGLIDLREGFDELGYKEQARKITYALQHTETKALLNSKNIFDKVEGLLRLYLLEYTSKWGMSPGRPLFILLWLIPIFSFIYMFSLIGINENDGIWKVWIKERVRWDLGEVRPEKPLNCTKVYQIWGYGLYFSILSAFNIGWRELNVGNWIARVQPREYTLRASGWVRTVSGIQSLISVYLLALAVLTYFGRPFDQF